MTEIVVPVAEPPDERRSVVCPCGGTAFSVVIDDAPSVRTKIVMVKCIECHRLRRILEVRY